MEYPHQGEFPIGSYLKVNILLKTWYLSCTCQRNFLKIIWKLIYMALFWATALKFLVHPSWPKMACNTKRLKIFLKSIFIHEGCTQKFRPVCCEYRKWSSIDWMIFHTYLFRTVYGTLQDWGPILLPKFTFFKSQSKYFLSML